MKEFVCSLLLLSMITVGVLAGNLKQTPQDLSDRLIRLHILANSNDPEDQQLKLLVRDVVRLATKELLQDVKSKDEAAVILAENLSWLAEVARGPVIAMGYDYPVQVEMGVHPFPDRTYGDLEVPAGDYLAVRVIIGGGQGDNWWCVLFPPLCLIEDQETQIVPKNTTEAAESGTGTVKIQYRWKFIDYLPQWLVKGGLQLRQWWSALAAGK